MSSTTLNETDLILLRRLVRAVEGASPYSNSTLAEAKLIAEMLAERIGMVKPTVAGLELVA